MLKTIKARIIIFSCILLMSVALCQILFSVFLSRGYYTRLKMTEVEKLFYDLKKNYSDDLSVIQNITRQAENTHNIRVQIFSGNELIYGMGLNILPPGFNYLNPSGSYSTEPKAAILKAPDMTQMPNRQNMPDLPNMRNMRNMRNLPQTNTENIILTGKFEHNGAPRFVRIMTSVEAIDASVAAITRINTIIAASVLFLGIIGSFVFAKMFSRPVHNIQEVARSVSLLNFNSRADENLSTVELRDLSCSINSMSDRLKELFYDLQKSNEKLKADVDYQKRLDKMRREFVANVSHELKTPLHLLLTYSENLKNNTEGIDKDYYCDTIIAETNRLNDMVKSLLDLSAIENGLERMKMEELDLSDLAANVVSKMSILLGEINVDVNIRESVFVDGDSQYLENVIKNFIMNAVSHTSPGGRVSIDLSLHNNKAVFSVFNEGSIIDEEDLAQIWESFYKADKARVRTDESHIGLGLYIVKTIIRSHGGECGVKNRENGVIFWFSLAGKK